MRVQLTKHPSSSFLSLPSQSMMEACFSFQTDGFLKDNNNAAQRLLDGMNFMAQSVSELSLGPTKAVTSWLTDQIAPAYWRPNSQILVWCGRMPLHPWHSPSCLMPLCPVLSLFCEGDADICCQCRELCECWEGEESLPASFLFVH